MIKKNITKYVGNSPGANWIGNKEFKYLKDIVKKKSPYRFKGKNKVSYCNKFEKNFSNYINKKYSLLVSSGTAAIHCALSTLKLTKGDEVILPAYGWSSDLMAVIATNFKPVFCSIDEKMGLDHKELAKNINTRTKAVIAIHMRGQSCDINKIKKICKEKKVFLIEDCSQCLGGMHENKHIGSFGDISIFSFQYNKLITAGEGGLIATNYLNIFKKINNFHDLGMGRKFNDPDPIGNVHKQFGLNYHASDLTGAFLLGQFENINLILKRLSQNRNKLIKFLDKDNNVTDFEVITPRDNSKPNNAFLLLKINNMKNKKSVVRYFKSKKINIQLNESIDGHNFNSWIKFLNKNKIKFLNKVNRQSKITLNRTFFIEISSL